MRTAHRLHTRALARLGAVALTVCLAAVGGAGALPAGASEPPRAPTHLWLVVVAHDGSHDTATLTCSPAGGSHPNAVAACRDLAIARGNFAELPGVPDATACPDVYAPVTVVAVGVWRGDPVDHRARYGNACVMRVMTGPVFQI